TYNVACFKDRVYYNSEGTGLESHHTLLWRTSMSKKQQQQQQFPPIKKIAISTGGGDAPGLNAVIRATALSALKRGWEVYGVCDGFHGILSPEEYPEGGFIRLTPKRVSGITHLGGTILGTS